MCTHMANGQPNSLETVAAAYFVGKVIPKEYPEGVKFTFGGKTEREFTTFGVNDDCFHKDGYVFLARLDSAAIKLDRQFKEQLRVELPRTSHSVKCFSKTKLWIYKATELDGLYYVELRLIRKMEGMHSFFLEIKRDGEVIRYCKATQIF